MKVRGLTPILNVTDIEASFIWFESLGWEVGFQWGEPVGFGSVCQSGSQGSDQGDCEIFLCNDGQGGRGKGNNTSTFATAADQSADKGVWMSLWVDDVDVAYAECIEAGIEVTLAPTDMPWNVREMHIRHPDGHVFRVSQGL